MTITRKITLDFGREELPKTIFAKQYDKHSRYVEITPYDNGQLYTLTTETARLGLTKPDGTTVFNPAIVSNGKITIELTEQILAVTGTAVAEIALYKGDSLISSQTFRITIAASAYDPSAPESSDEFNALTELINEIDNIDITGEQTVTGATITITDKSGVPHTFTLSNGAKGNKGDKGDQGDKGDKGDKGDQGDPIATVNTARYQTPEDWIKKCIADSQSHYVSVFYCVALEDCVYDFDYTDPISEQVTHYEGSMQKGHVYAYFYASKRVVDEFCMIGYTPVKGTDYFTAAEISEIINEAAARVSVPTKVSDLTNDSNFQTAAQVTAAINAAIGNAIGGAY